MSEIPEVYDSNLYTCTLYSVAENGDVEEVKPPAALEDKLVSVEVTELADSIELDLTFGEPVTKMDNMSIISEYFYGLISNIKHGMECLELMISHLDRDGEVINYMWYRVDTLVYAKRKYSVLQAGKLFTTVKLSGSYKLMEGYTNGKR